MRKKSLFLVLSLSAIAGLWTGCSKDEVVEAPAGSRAISFRMQGGLPSLRATGTTADYVNAFVVNAYGDSTGVDHTGSGGPNRKATMLGTTVYRLEGVTSTFDYNPKAFYYAEDDSVHFSAYSPVSKNIGSGLGLGDTKHENKITYTVLPPDTLRGNTQQEDLLVAFTTKLKTDFGTAVSLDFKHALSRVYVKATNLLSETAIIDTIRLVNLYDTGTLDIDDDTWAATTTTPPVNPVDKPKSINESYYNSITAMGDMSDYKILWTPSGSQDKTFTYALPASGVAVPGGGPGAAAVSVVSVEQGMLLLPQTVWKHSTFNDATDFYLEIHYKVANIEETTKFSFADVNAIGAAAAAEKGITFEFGRQYALNITFNNAGISFSISVEAWDTPVIDVSKP
ncbi:MAG: fimbrillin family protein [Dysgonamonadaceae bacterium]|jgi:hypothetical protein|nr:fimbrillin family protein [Dysgonamonadaceae bacterium]